MEMLKKANEALKNKNYKEALSIYKSIQIRFPHLSDLIEFNIRYISGKITGSDCGLSEKSQSNDYLVNKESSRYEGNIESFEDGCVRGWAVNKEKPSDIFELSIYLDGFLFSKARNHQKREDLRLSKKSSGQGGFIVRLPNESLLDSHVDLEVKFPDGSTFARFFLNGKLKNKINQTPIKIDKAAVSIIVPIYNAADDVQICIERLLKYTSSDVDILLIDDASTDPKIKEILAGVSDHKNIRVFYNDVNLGFTKTVNRGIDLAEERDVVLLNSDARVTPRWLEGLKVALSSDERIATVTPMSDRAGAFSAPQIGNENVLPDGVMEQDYARAFRRRGLGLYPSVPTGNGFCLYIRRACIKDIGKLDADAFPVGYGEENDFCMRALRKGWKHIIDDRTYVFHERSKSFGDTKKALMKAGRTVIDERYPDYKFAIQVFNNDEHIAIARYRAHLAVQDCLSMPLRGYLPRTLFVLSTKTGGTPQTNQDLMKALKDVFECWVLRCDSRVLELMRMTASGELETVRKHTLSEAIEPLTHDSSEYNNVVSGWLVEFDFSLVHIRHLAWHSLALPRLAKDLDLKVVYSFHDYYALSPNLKLIDDKGQFLGETYSEKPSVYRESLWPEGSHPVPQGSWLDFWRVRFEQSLSYCDALVTTSNSARQLIIDAMPNLDASRFVVIPHGRDFVKFSRIRHQWHGQGPIRILVPGTIDAVKGLEVIRALIDHDQEGRLEFHVLGRIKGKIPERGVVALGAYKREEFAEKAASVQPHLGAVFSVWDETYCHTLTELFSVGLPAAVLNYPNVANRVTESGAGWVLESIDIPVLYEEILRIAGSEEEFQSTEQAITNWQQGYGLANSTAQMAASYLSIYGAIWHSRDTDKALSPFARKRIAVVCPVSEDLSRAPASTHIRIWERTHNAIDRAVTYIKMTPHGLLASARTKMIDGVIIQRTAIPVELVDGTLAALKEAGLSYVFDLDDNLLEVPKEKDPDQRYEKYRESLEKIIRSAKVVTTSTPTLKNYLEQFNNNVILLPNKLSQRIWAKNPKPRIKDGYVRALYMGTATHDDDLMMVLPALEEVAKSYPQFRLALIGVTDKPELWEKYEWIEVIKPPVSEYDSFVPWLLDQTYLFDFAIAPLKDTAFNNYKSDLKLLDYNHLGIPVIVSNINIYKYSKLKNIKLVDNINFYWVKYLNYQVENKKLGIEVDVNKSFFLRSYFDLDGFFN